MPRAPRRRLGVLVATLALTAVSTVPPLVTGSAAAATSPHTQQAVSPFSSYTMRWTRADAQQIVAQSDLSGPPGSNSLPLEQTMPSIPGNFPVMVDQRKPAGKNQVWVWDTWPMTDAHGNQYSYKGWDVIFSLTADPYAGYTFDDRHVHARISFWYRKNTSTGPWLYGGHVFGNRTPQTQAEWSGSTRIMDDGGIKLFYTHLDFANRNRPVAQISLSEGRVHADANRVWFTGMAGRTKLLEPEGTYYQTPDQNPYFSFRDPFTFEDPRYPGRTFMVFEGNTAGKRGDYRCQTSDLGDSGEDPAAVTASGANNQLANIGLAVATRSDLTRWQFLPPILSGNCVNDQTERPQFVIRRENGQWKYYLFTISHAFTYAAGLRGPDGVYGFVGNGIRSDFQPLNQSGLALGNPIDLNLANTDAEQNPRVYQAYSHYVMPGGLVESFIDRVGSRRGGTLAPTVKLDITGETTAVDRSVGNGGLLGYGYIPANIDMVEAPGGGLRMVRQRVSVR